MKITSRTSIYEERARAIFREVEDAIIEQAYLKGWFDIILQDPIEFKRHMMGAFMDYLEKNNNQENQDSQPNLFPAPMD